MTAEYNCQYRAKSWFHFDSLKSTKKIRFHQLIGDILLKIRTKHQAGQGALSVSILPFILVSWLNGSFEETGTVL